MQKILIFIIATLNTTFGFCQKNESNLEIYPLTGDFYIYKTYGSYKGNKIPANGMYLLTNDGAVLFDTPWDTTQFQPLLDSIQSRHHKKVLMCFATHFHEDRTAGLEYYRQQGIQTYTTSFTDSLSRQNGMKRAAFLMTRDTVFNVGKYSFEMYYPGEGHAPDNIVAWFKKEKVLYGGCLVKSVDDSSLGNLSDANVKEYANTIIRLKKKCKHPRFIITGHNDWKNIKSLDHTLEMAKTLKEKQIR